MCGSSVWPFASVGRPVPLCEVRGRGFGLVCVCMSAVGVRVSSFVVVRVCTVCVVVRTEPTLNPFNSCVYGWG